MPSIKEYINKQNNNNKKLYIKKFREICLCSLFMEGKKIGRLYHNFGILNHQISILALRNHVVNNFSCFFLNIFLHEPYHTITCQLQVLCTLVILLTNIMKALLSSIVYTSKIKLI